MRRYAVLAVCVFLFFATPAGAEFYRWVDRDGKEFFTNDLEKVPPEYRGGASRVQPDESRVSIGGRTPAPGKTRKATAVHKDKNGKGEEYWRKRAAGIRLKLRDQQEEQAAVLKQLDEQEEQPKTLNGKKNKTLASLEKKSAKLEKDIAKTKKLLEVDLPEEARRADAYPGWIRE